MICDGVGAFDLPQTYSPPDASRRVQRRCALLNLTTSAGTDKSASIRQRVEELEHLRERVRLAEQQQEDEG